MLALLLLVLAAGPPAPTVVSVVLDVPAADRQRLQRYVELRSGEPLCAESVRHTVELLFATGEFADVVAESRSLDDGVEVTFRPVFAPRLRTLRVVGDRVRKPSEIARAARLRTGDLLTEARLDRASRDVAVALVADGYLEAQVSARAPEAVGGETRFELRAGQRSRVSHLDAEAPVGVRAAVLGMARPQPGSVFRRAEAVASAEKIRKRLVAMGFWRATVAVRERYDPGTAGMALTFEATAGPFIRVEFEGERPPASLRRSVERLLRDGSLKPDVIEEASDLIEAHYLAEGHREARVTHRQEQVALAQRIVYRAEPGPPARVASVRVLGAPELLLQPLLLTRAGEPLQDRLLEEDTRRLKRALEDDGYAEARVDLEVPEGGGVLPVVLRARPGTRTVIASLDIRADVAPPEKAWPPELRERAALPYRVRDLALDRADLQTRYRNAGYLRAVVTPDLSFSEDGSEAHVVLRVDAGPRTTVDAIVVTGLERTREAVVRRELLVEEGRPLGLQAVLESQRRLSALGLFESASISELDAAEAGRTLVIRAREGPLTTVAYGLGYAERDLLRGSAEATRRNLFGMDRSLSGLARISFRGSRLLASYREPYLFGRRQELFATAFREDEDRDSFDFIRYGGLFQTSHALSKSFRLILRYSYLRTNTFNIDVPLDEVDRQFQNSTFSGPSFSLVNDARDDALDPRSGHFVGADLQLSLGALGGDSFAKSYLQGAVYRRLQSRVILALSGRLGLSTTFGAGVPDRLPLPDRFFAGGDYSLRGFKIDSVDPEGGNALLLGSAEVRVDASRRFSVAAFSDIGNVYPLVGDLSLSDLRYAAGFGIRYRSAVGPIRVDLGFKLDRRPDESLTHLHVTVGHAF